MIPKTEGPVVLRVRAEVALCAIALATSVRMEIEAIFSAPRIFLRRRLSKRFTNESRRQPFIRRLALGLPTFAAFAAFHFAASPGPIRLAHVIA